VIRVRFFALILGYVVETAIVAGWPLGLLALQWGAALRAVFFPSTTCWIATAGGHYMTLTEFPAMIFIYGLTMWLSIAVITAGVSDYLFGSRFGRRWIVGTAIVALASGLLLWLGTNWANSLEREAYLEFRENC
jgi:hypothetical protein